MNRLSGLDASFVYLESPAQLLHVCGVVMLSPETMPTPYSFETLKTEMDRRIRVMPDFRKSLRMVPFALDHPVWVVDEDFDIDRHVHRVTVQAPGGEEELAEIVGHLAEQPLDRTRPLWEMAVIEGLASGQIAVFTKMHHPIVDGVSGSNLISACAAWSRMRRPSRRSSSGTTGCPVTSSGGTQCSLRCRQTPELREPGRPLSRHPDQLDRPGPQRYGDAGTLHRAAHVL